MSEPTPDKIGTKELDKSVGPQAQVNPRELRGRQTALMQGQITKDGDSYRVRSQSGSGQYQVNVTQSGWNCNCADFKIKGVYACKHIFAVQIQRGLKETVRTERERNPVVIEQFDATKCLFCQSPNLKKFGLRHNKSGDIQRFMCLACSHSFSVNLGFEKMKHNPQAITAAMTLYFNGESLRNTAESLALIGAKVSHQTIFNWIAK